MVKKGFKIKNETIDERADKTFYELERLISSDLSSLPVGEIKKHPFYKGLTEGMPQEHSIPRLLNLVIYQESFKVIYHDALLDITGHKFNADFNDVFHIVESWRNWGLENNYLEKIERRKWL